MRIGRFATTAMAIMPHTQADAALKLAFDLDVPFSPQLPHLGFDEDMYVQSLEGFPGVFVDFDGGRLIFRKDAFVAALDDYVAALESGTPLPMPRSATYEAFLERDLGSYAAVRGQVMGPISCGFRLIDDAKRPVIYDDDVRSLLLDFVARAANVQLETLARRNENVFVFMDEPGLGMVFSGLSGYNETRAETDLCSALEAVHGDVAIHLCGRPDWDFLLRLPIAMLSFNAFANGRTFVAQVDGIRSFLARGGVLCWGMVPTHEALLEKLSIDFLADQLGELMQTLIDGGIETNRLVDQSMLAPATCNLAGTPTSVEQAFGLLRDLADEMRQRWT